MRGKYKAYLFERFENFGTLEAKDVYTQLDRGTYSIEHIMPQHLNAAWMRALGPEAESIHSTWLHRLGNLTLTAYNAHMSNDSFLEKRDAEHGYRKSGLRMNQQIAQKDRWGLAEMEERSEAMVAQATEIIWPMPSTSFVPAEKEFDSCTLDDEDVDLTGRDIVKYSYLNAETPVASWTDMYEHMVRYLHEEDKSVLSTVVYHPEETTGLHFYFSHTPDALRKPLKIDEGVYTEMHTSTATKISTLRKLFLLFHANPMDLVFFLRGEEQDQPAENIFAERRKRYWAYALPVIQEENKEEGHFRNCHPTANNAINGSFGIGGFQIACVANRNCVRVELVLSKNDPKKNLKAFDILQAHQAEIEHALHTSLSWNRAENHRAFRISCALRNVHVSNEEDWPRMAKFQAEWSRKLLAVLVPYLKGSE